MAEAELLVGESSLGKAGRDNWGAVGPEVGADAVLVEVKDLVVSPAGIIFLRLAGI